jgi:hypothetical protein
MALPRDDLPLLTELDAGKLKPLFPRIGKTASAGLNGRAIDGGAAAARPIRLRRLP